MNALTIPFLPDVDYQSDDNAIAAALAPITTTALETVPWLAYPYKPSVHFKMGHTKDSLVLQFLVAEKHIQAAYRDTNDPVYRDSCVEFFIAFDNHNYYNLEFNCIGTALVGYGSANKRERITLPAQTVEQIKTYTVINPDQEKHKLISWRLLLNIPLTVFVASGIGDLSGMLCTGNFYKCGDDLPEPHFLTWNHIDYPVPNFHVPECFGKLFFL